MTQIEQRISEIGIIPVIKLDHPERDAISLARALCAGGVSIAEITFRAAGAPKAIQMMREACPEMLVGAGTVLTTQQVDSAVAASAEFIVSPGLDAELVRYCQRIELPIFPGCTTASEYQKAYGLGLNVLKFFPAEQCGGIAAIKALSGPFPMFRIMPTGGISLKNLRDYASNPMICACGGYFMAPANLINAQKWDEITALCKEVIKSIQEVRHG